MNYIENIYICLAAPLLVAIMCLRGTPRRLMIFMLSGMTACLLSSYISTFLTMYYGTDRLRASVEFAPSVEEFMKLVPVLFYLIVFLPKKENVAGGCILTAIGFATFENVCYLLENDASNVVYLLIRGFGTGAMHIITGMILYLGFYYLWDQVWLRIAGTLGLLCVAIVYHAIYNILVLQTGGIAQVGYVIPMITAVAMVVFQKMKKLQSPDT